MSEFGGEEDDRYWDEFAKVILRLEPLPCGYWVGSIVAEFPAGKSTVQSAYSRDGDNCAMQLRRRVQTY